MTFLNYSVPLLRRKQLNIEEQDLEWLWQVQFPLGKDRFYSKFYTCLDRACLLWSLLLIPMFGTIFSCELEKIVGESLSSVVGKERNRVFGDWIRSAIVRAFSSKFVSPVGDFNFALHRLFVFPIDWSRNGI